MITVVAGSTFQLLGRFLFNSRSMNGAHWASVRLTLSDFRGQKFTDLNFEWIDLQKGIARVWADDTSRWPVGRVRIDCEVVDGYGDTWNAVADYFRLVESTLNA